MTVLSTACIVRRVGRVSLVGVALLRCQSYVHGLCVHDKYLCRRASSRRMSSVSPRMSWLTTALLRMHLARAANASVDAVSEQCSCAGLTLAMISVFALPPRDSCTDMSVVLQRWLYIIAKKSHHMKWTAFGGSLKVAHYRLL